MAGSATRRTCRWRAGESSGLTSTREQRRAELPGCDRPRRDAYPGDSKRSSAVYQSIAWSSLAVGRDHRALHVSVRRGAGASRELDSRVSSATPFRPVRPPSSLSRDHSIVTAANRVLALEYSCDCRGARCRLWYLGHMKAALRLRVARRVSYGPCSVMAVCNCSSQLAWTAKATTTRDAKSMSHARA